MALNPELGESNVQQKLAFGDNTTSTYKSALTNKSQTNSELMTQVMGEIASERGIEMSAIDPNEVAEIVAKSNLSSSLLFSTFVIVLQLTTYNNLF